MFTNLDNDLLEEGDFLELEENNLYATATLLVLPNGEKLLYRDKLVWTGDLQDDYHVVTQQDRIDKLAWKFYSPFVPDASKYWWVIADANNILNPLDLSELLGQEILIPNILNVRLVL